MAKVSLRRSRCALPLMPIQVAERAGGDDVSGVVPSTVAPGDKMLGSALERVDGYRRQSVLCNEPVRLAEPHWQATVVAEAALMFERALAQ